MFHQTLFVMYLRILISKNSDKWAQHKSERLTSTECKSTRHYQDSEKNIWKINTKNFLIQAIKILKNFIENQTAKKSFCRDLIAKKFFGDLKSKKC